MKYPSNFLVAVPFVALSMLVGCGELSEPDQNASSQLKIQGPRLSAENPLLTDFTAATGVQIKLVEYADEADLLQVIDTGNLQRLMAEGRFQPITSTQLEERLSPHLADLDRGWMGYAVRSRIIYYNPEKISNPPTHYADLADPRFRGQLCLGAGTSLYNTSMVAALLGHLSEEASEQWIEGLLANLAEPAGGRDSELLARVAENNACHLTVANHYYYARLAGSDDPQAQAVTSRLQPVWPEQDGRGSLQNVAAFALVESAAEPELATRFLEYAASDAAQKQVAEGIFLPVVELDQPAAAQQLMGVARLDQQPLSEVAERSLKARKLVKKLGWD